MNIDNITQRQFDFSMRREKITITDYYDPSIQYDVFFRRDNRGTSPQGKLRLFYAEDTPINIGTIFILGNDNYLVMSKESIEGVVYRSSMAVKCTEQISIRNTDDTYTVVPFAMETGRYVTTTNETISIIDGSVTIYTGLNDTVKQMDGDYNCFGGRYSVQNHLYNDGIAYIYLSREADMPDVYALIYNGDTSVELEAGTYQLTYTASINNIPVENPTLSYVSGNTEVATVSDTGLLTLLSAGDTTITATWTEQEITCETSITVTAQTPSGTTSIDGRTNLINGYSREYTGKVLDGSGVEVPDVIGIWTITDCTFTEEIEQIVDGNKITLSVDNRSLIGETLTLNFSVQDGNYTPSSLVITVTSLY